MVIFVLFGGIGGTEKSWKYEFSDGNIKKNNFIKELKKIGLVYFVSIPYTSLYYYDPDKKNLGTFYHTPSNKKITLLDFDLTYRINIIYHDLKHIIKDNKLILIGWSHGIYYALEFAKKYPKSCKNIISLDGSWISKTMLKNRLQNWKNKNNDPIEINNQTKLDEIINSIKLGNSKKLFDIMHYIRYLHTIYAIKHKYENLIVPMIVFRDLIIKKNCDTEDNKFNYYTQIEHERMKKINENKYIEYYLPNASHLIFSKKENMEFIVSKIKDTI